jgi:hypothetical protein
VVTTQREELAPASAVPARPGPRPRRRAATTWRPLALIVLLAVGLPQVSAAASGALHLPWNDDWAYARAALELADTGRFRLRGWGVMGLLGHVLWAQPWLALLGDGLAVLRAAQAVAAVLGLLATYAFARAFLPRPRSLLVTALVAAAPAYAVLSTSFMTDTTAFALQMTCLAAGAHALRRPAPWPLAALSLVTGLAATTVRELTLAAPLAVLCALVLVPGTSRRALGWAAAGFAAAVGVFLLWRAGVPGAQRVTEGADVVSAAAMVVRGLATVALALAPALLLNPRLRLLRGGRAAALAGALVMAPVLFVVAGGCRVFAGGTHDLLAGNVLERSGPLGAEVALGPRPPLLPAAVWDALGLLAAAAALVLAATLAAATARAVARGPWPRRLGRATPGDVLLGVGLLGGVGGLGVQALAGGAVFDRYLWALVALGAVAVLRGKRPMRWADLRWTAARGWAVGLAALSLLLTFDAHAYTAARWAAGERAVAEGHDPADIDAGFEWAGWHHDGDVALAGGEAAVAPLRMAAPHPGYLLLFRRAGNCITVANARQPAPLRLTALDAYRALPVLPFRYVYTYRNPAACQLSRTATR